MINRPGLGRPLVPPSSALTLAKRGLQAALLMACVACTQVIDQRGNLPDQETVATIKPGVQTKAQIIDLLGSPSNVATFNDRTWYYIGRRTATESIFKPEMIDQKIVVIKFDDAGVVASIDTFGPEVARAVEPNEQETPTAGNTLGILQQLFGNIGRFGSASGRAGQNGGRSSGGGL